MSMAQGGVIVFEANNADFKNRKRAARACLSCQKRKKRCGHTFARGNDEQAEKDTAEKVLPQLIHKEPVKFVGDTNPESVLTDLTQRPNDETPRVSRIGIWVEQSRFEQDQFRHQKETAAQNRHGESDTGTKKQTTSQKFAKIERGRRVLNGHLKNYLQNIGALRVLPKTTQDALVTTYVSCIDPLFPIIDCKKLLRDYANGEASVFLVQAICLVACKTEEALPFLRLTETDELKDPIPFARELHTGLDAAMKADLEADRFTKVQIMTLMSLHNDGNGGIEESSLHLTMAIHDAQTTGLHINTPGRTRNDQAAMLWWTLWTLDKFNACLGGRPLMIADRDIDIDKPNPESSVRSQTMAIWLAMGALLDDVIEYYRPNVDPETAGWEKDFPSFTELTKNCSQNLLGESQRNLLEICYNIIGILSCRAGGPKTQSYNRRIVSADRIQQLTAGGRQAQLPPLPLVPYAISLSLTVAYRGLRDSHCDPIKAQADLAARCGILESMNKTWWTADAMAKLGRKALSSIQQPPQTDSAVDGRKSAAGLTVGDALEAEVSPCKYGPFDGKATNNQKRPATSLSNGQMSSKAPDPNGVSSDRLHMLSQAAAQVGDTKRTLNIANLTLNDPTAFIQRTTSFMPHPNKKPRYNNDKSLLLPSTSQRTPTSNTFSPQSNTLIPDTPPEISHISTRTTTPATTPQGGLRSPFANQNPKNGDYIINPLLDPYCATTDLTPASLTGMQLQHPRSRQAIPSGTLSTTTNGTAMAMPSSFSAPQIYNPRMSVPLHHSYSYLQNVNQNGLNPAPNPSARDMIDLDLYNYNELDTLFDGFFDLSMPTMFEDPLFEDPAYDQFAFFNGGQISSGPSGPGSVDMGLQQPLQRQNKNPIEMNVNMNVDMNSDMSTVRNGMNGINDITNLAGMGNINLIRSNTGDSQRNINMSRPDIGSRGGDMNGSSRNMNGRRNRYSNNMMDMDIDLSGMNSMNKISPELAASHWYWNEDDF